MTSIPASCSARAMNLAPRSCPSKPGLATRTRMRWPESLNLVYPALRSHHDVLAKLSERVPQHVADFAERDPRVDAVHDGRHHILARRRVASQPVERRTHQRIVTPGAESAQALDLIALERRIDAQDRDSRLGVVAELVDADDDARARVDLLLQLEGRLLHL